MPGELTQQRRVQSLEIVRFIAAFSVVVFHYQFYFFDSSISQSKRPLYAVLSSFYNSGSYAVQWFWVLSGFVIFLNYADDIAIEKVPWRVFFFRRFARLYPLHLLTLILVCTLFACYKTLFHETYWLYAQESNWSDLGLQLLFASNWFSTEFTFNGPIWSVSVEVLIYALFFFVVAMTRQNVIKASIIVCVLSVVVYYVAAYLHAGIEVWIAKCSFCFFGGGIISKVVAHINLNPFGIAGYGYKRIAGWIAACMFVAGLYAIRPAYALELALPMVGICFVASCSTTLERWPILARINWIGDLTYGSYLWHFPIAFTLVIAMRVAGVDRGVADSPPFLIGYLALVFIVAAASFLYIESPARRVIRSWENSHNNKIQQQSVVVRLFFRNSQEL